MVKSMLGFLKRNRAFILCAAVLGIFLVFSWGPGPPLASAIGVAFLQGIYNDGKRAEIELMRNHLSDGGDLSEAIFYERQKMRRWFFL